MALTQTDTAALIPSTALPQRLTAPLRPRTTCLWSWPRATSADLMRLYVPPAAALVVPIGFAAMTISGRVALPQPLTAHDLVLFHWRKSHSCERPVFVGYFLYMLHTL